MTHDGKKMQKNTCLSIVLSMAAILVTGCTTPTTRNSANETSTEASRSDVRHIVAPGDRLSDIALKYTGKVGQWQTIAAYNNITDPRTLRIGDTVTIPASLLPVQALPRNEQRTLALTGTPDNNHVTAATGNALALQRVREETTGTSGVKVKSVTTNRSFQLQPIDASTLRNTPTSGASPPRIKVVGTYYPKGIYQQPASYSTLMMRAAPGTIFELDREVNDWFKIMTNKGIGYLRSADGKILPDD